MSAKQLLPALLGCLVLACDGGGGKADVDAGGDGGPDGGPDGVTLEPGDVLVLESGADGAFLVDVETGSGDEEYVLLLTSGSRQPGGAWPYEVTVDGAALPGPEATGPWGYDGALPAPPPPAHAPPRGWNEALDALRAGAGPAGPTRADPPEVGATIAFSIDGGAGIVSIDAEVMSVTEELVIAFDRTTTPDLDIDAEILAEVAQNFAEIVLPRERIYFGEESDVNGDERVTMLFSPLTFQGSGGATAYVHPCDLLAAGATGCSYSNEQELIYLSPPELLAPHMGTANAITETVAHEFQHAIYFWRKVVLNDATGQHESLYVTEGMSAMAQDVSGFQAGNLYVAAAAIEDVDSVSMAGILAWPLGYNEQLDGVWRGAAYLLVRWAFERAGGDVMDDQGVITDLGGVAFLNDMTDLAAFGYDGLEAATGATAEELIASLYVAMLLGDREADGAPLCGGSAACFDPPWTDPITGRQHGIAMRYDLAGGSWKVRGVPLQQGGADGTIRAGGAEYVLIPAPEGGGAMAVGASAGETAVLGARLVRIR
jgi:hypothetical protein